MTKTPFKDFADAVGYGLATSVTAEMNELTTYMARVNAERKAQGRPTLEEDEAEALDILIEHLDAGALENDPELKEAAIDAKKNRDAHK